MPTRLLLSMLTALALSGCFATAPRDPAPAVCPRLPPLQGEAAQALEQLQQLERQEPTYMLKMERFLSGRLPEQIDSESSSSRASASTRAPEKR